MKRLTLKQVNAAIAQVIARNVFIIKGKGYFYVASDDPKEALFLAGLRTTSIAVARVSHLSVSSWIMAVKLILEDKGTF